MIVQKFGILTKLENDMSEIIFDGVKITQTKAGFWKCPFGCHVDKRYPTPKWKTEKGFIKHLEKCSKTPSAIEKQKNEKQKKLETLDSLKEEFIKTLDFKIGDEVSFVKKIVVEDTHEWRWNRQVRVRYEPVLKFEAVKTTITSINFYEPLSIPAFKDMKNLVYFNNGISLDSIMKNYNEAVKIAKEKTIADEEYRKECSNYR